MRAAFSDLDRAFGPDVVARLASAYEAALVVALASGSSPALAREIRLAIVTELVAAARRGVTDAATLKEVAIAALGRRDGYLTGRGTSHIPPIERVTT